MILDHIVYVEVRTLSSIHPLGHPRSTQPSFRKDELSAIDPQILCHICKFDVSAFYVSFAELSALSIN
jgi:hypothetical protein